MSYPGHSLVGRESYLSVEAQLAYSTAPANWVNFKIVQVLVKVFHVLHQKSHHVNFFIDTDRDEHK